jgi:hypothetical protein
MKNKWFVCLCVILISGFVLVSCDTGNGNEDGSSPTKFEGTWVREEYGYEFDGRLVFHGNVCDVWSWGNGDPIKDGHPLVSKKWTRTFTFNDETISFNGDVFFYELNGDELTLTHDDTHGIVRPSGVNSNPGPETYTKH